MDLDKLVRLIAKKLRISENEVYNMIEKKKKELFDMITDEAAAYIIIMENNIDLEESDVRKLTISDLVPKMRGVNVEGILKRKFPEKEFEKNGEKGSYQIFILSDGENEIKVVVWSKTLIESLKRIPEGSKIRVINGYTREGKNGLEIHLGSDSGILLLQKGFRYKKKHIEELREGDRAYLVGIIRRVFDIKEYSKGIINSFILDDGTGIIRCVYFGEKPVIEKDDVWKEYFVVGRTRFNEVTNRLEFVVESVERYNPKKELFLMM